MFWLIKRLKAEMGEKGQTIIEYVLVLVLIVLILVAAFRAAEIENAVGEQAERIENTMVNTD